MPASPWPLPVVAAAAGLWLARVGLAPASTTFFAGDATGPRADRTDFSAVEPLRLFAGARVGMFLVALTTCRHDAFRRFGRVDPAIRARALGHFLQRMPELVDHLGIFRIVSPVLQLVRINGEVIEFIDIVAVRELVAGIGIAFGPDAAKAIFCPPTMSGLPPERSNHRCTTSSAIRRAGR